MLNEKEMEEAKKDLDLFFGEYLAGGFDEKWLREEVVAIFNEYEGRYDENFELGNVDDLAERWREIIKDGLYR